MFLSLMLFMSPKMFSYEVMSIFLLTLFVKSLSMMQFLHSMYSFQLIGGVMDNTSVVLMILTIFIFMLSFLSSNLVLKFNNIFYNMVMVLLLGSLTFLFFTSSFFNLYIYFEFSILPIFLLIMGWGYQTERVSAGMALMMYTISASMPLLIVIMNYMSNMNIIFMYQFSFNMSSNYTNYIVIMSLVLAFLIKLPIFLGHLWLPKAHVEAPVVGSMILASVLLKLGGYGLIRVAPLMTSNYLTNLVISISMTGSALIGLICMNQLDMKVIIAYSSVAHMGLVISSLLYLSSVSMAGAIMLMMAHGLSSSAMFFCGNLLYLRSSTRSIMLSKGMLGTVPLMSFLWFLTLMSSMAAPPMINLFAEIICISTIISFSSYNMMWAAMAVLLAGAYSLILYSSTQQSTFFNITVKLKVTGLSESLILFSHVYWLLLMILSAELFFNL